MDPPEAPASGSTGRVLVNWLREAAKAGLGLWRAAGFLLAAQIASFGAVFCISRLLGPADYGLFGAFQLAASYATLFVQWGTEPLVTRSLAQGSVEDHRRTLAAFVRQRSLATLLVVAGSAAAFGPAWAGAFPILLVAGVLEGALVSFSNPPAFDAAARIASYQAIVLARQAGYFATALALYLALADHATVAVVALAHAGSLAFQIGLEWRWIRKTYGALAWDRASRDARRLWIDALPLAITTSAGYCLDLVGQTALALAAGPRAPELGHLVLSNQVAMVATSFVGLASRWFLVHVSSLVADPARMVRRVVQAVILFTAAGIAASAFLSLVVSGWIPFFFGDQYRPAAGVFAVDAWRIAGVLVGSAATAGLVATGRNRALAISTLLALATAALAAVYAVPQFGARGGALAVVLGRAAFAVYPTVAFFLPARVRRG